MKIYISQPDVLELAQKDKDGISSSTSGPPQVPETERKEKDKGRYGAMDKFISGRIGYIIQCALCPRGLEVRFRDPNQEKAGFKFKLGPFDSGKEIVHNQEELEKSKVMTYKVTEKKVTVTLKKVDGSLTWYDLKAPNGSADGFDTFENGGEEMEDAEDGMEDAEEE